MWRSHVNLLIYLFCTPTGAFIVEHRSREVSRKQSYMMARLLLSSFMLPSLACSIAADKGLRFKSYSKDRVMGSYEHNQGLEVNFDVRKSAMKIEKTTVFLLFVFILIMI